jgi:hypothetical protein
MRHQGRLQGTRVTVEAWWRQRWEGKMVGRDKRELYKVDVAKLMKITPFLVQSCFRATS